MPRNSGTGLIQEWAQDNGVGEGIVDAAGVRTGVVQGIGTIAYAKQNRTFSDQVQISEYVLDPTNNYLPTFAVTGTFEVIGWDFDGAGNVMKLCGNVWASGLYQVSPALKFQTPAAPLVPNPTLPVPMHAPDRVAVKPPSPVVIPKWEDPRIAKHLEWLKGQGKTQSQHLGLKA